MQVLTQNGFKQFSGIIKNNKRKTLVEIISEKGTLVCTDDHKVLLSDGTFLEAGFLDMDTILHGNNKILSVSFLKNQNEYVYDLASVEETSSYLTNGIVSHNCLLLDEFAFVPKNIAEDFFASVYPTIASGKESKLIVVSTPKGFNHFYTIWAEAEQGKNGFNPVFINWDDIPGRDQAWKEETLKSYGANGEEKFRQEFCAEFLGSSNTLISSGKLRNLIPKPPVEYNESTNIYYKPDPIREYLLIGDTSEGKGGDYHALVVYDISEFPIKIAAVYRENTSHPSQLPGTIYNLAKYYNNAWVFIETNGRGQEISNSVYHDYEYENMVFLGKNKDTSGKTTAKTKKIGCSALKELVETEKLLIEDHQMIKELNNFIQQGSTYAAEEGSNDDLVMTAVIFAWLMTTKKVKNLTDKDFQKAIREENRESMLPSSLMLVSDGVSEPIQTSNGIKVVNDVNAWLLS